MVPFLICGTIIVVLVSVLVFRIIEHNKKRIASIQALAPILKLRYAATGDDSLGPLLCNFEFFAQGRSKITNLLRGNITRQGRFPSGNAPRTVEVAIFDYQYTVGKQYDSVSFDEGSVSVSSDSDTQTYWLTALVFYDECLNIPSFNLRPEFFTDKVANAFGFKDINFRNFPNFSKHYRLDSEYPEDVQALFQPNLLKFYEANHLRTEANGPYLLFFPFPASKHQQSVVMIDGVTHMTSQLLSADEIQQYLDLSWQAMDLMEKNTTMVGQR